MFSRALIACLMMLAISPAYSSEPGSAPDTVIVNGKIYSANPDNPYPEAIAITDGLITSVGSNEQVMDLVGANTQVINAQGQMVLPGFIDNHNHVFEAASEAGGNCELIPYVAPVKQIPALKHCKESAIPGQWLIGWGHTFEETLDENSSKTPLEVIDSVFDQQPVIIMEQTSHSMWVNSVALELANIDAQTPHPVGGKIMRDEETGELLGILVDNAGVIVMEQAWNSLRDKFSASYQGLMVGLDESASKGITTIGDGRMYWQRGWYEVWQEAQSNQDLTARVSLRPWIYPHIKPEQQLPFLKQIQSDDTDSLLIVNQVKIYSDGILINASAKLLSPYAFTFFPEDPLGFNYIPQAQMTSWLLALNKIGYGAHIHAIGDGAVHESLNAIEQARKSGSDKSYNLTHVEMVNEKDWSRFKLLNVDADFQIGSEYVAEQDHDWAIPFIGAMRAHRLMPLRKLYDKGANITLSSDWNVNPLSPLASIANSIRLKQYGLPSVEAAIDAYTINAAKALGLDAITGSIEVGKSADLVVLNSNILNASANKIARTKVNHTILQGEFVFSR